MKLRLVTVSIVTLFQLQSCGKEEKDFSGLLGSCKHNVGIDMPDGTDDIDLSMCFDYSYTAKAKEDPSADAKTEIKTSCEASTNATFSTSACTTTGHKGICAISVTSAKATVSGKIYYTGSSFTEETAKESCDSAEGTFSTK